VEYLDVVACFVDGLASRAAASYEGFLHVGLEQFWDNALFVLTFEGGVICGGSFSMFRLLRGVV